MRLTRQRGGFKTMHASDEDVNLLKSVIERAEFTIYGSMNPAM